MKRYGILIIGLVFVSFVSAVPLPGFWGIPWGSSSAEVETAMSQKGLKAYYKANEGFLYKDVSFAGRKGDLALILKDSTLATASFMFYPEKNNAYTAYTALKKDLIEKYGAPKSDEEIYLYPYSKSDGQTEFAITMGYVKISSSWVFEEGNIILLRVNKDSKSNRVEIMLAYYNTNAADSMLEKKKQTIMEDL